MVLRFNFGPQGNQEWMEHCRPTGTSLEPRQHGAATLRSCLLKAWPGLVCSELPRKATGERFDWAEVKRQHQLSLGVAWVLSQAGAQACSEAGVDIQAVWTTWDLPEAAYSFSEHPAWAPELSLELSLSAVGPDICEPCPALAATPPRARSTRRIPAEVRPTPLPRPTEPCPWTSPPGSVQRPAACGQFRACPTWPRRPVRR